MERLEDRSLLASLPGLIEDLFALVPATRLAGAAALTDDSYEQNDTSAAASNLGTLTATTTINNLVMADGADWYKFTLASNGTSANSAAINFLHSQGDLDIQLFNSAGQMLRYSNGITNTEQVSLSGLLAGTYYLDVFGYRGVTNPKYSLTITPPGGTSTPPTPPPAADDAYENNDTSAAASNLGTISADTIINNLVLADSDDWYTFSMTTAGTSANFVKTAFTSSQGDLDLELYNSAGTRVGLSNGTTNSEQISLSGLAAGTYKVHVYGYQGATNPSYSLEVNPYAPPPTPPPTPTDDSYENNDTITTAASLGTLTADKVVNSLVSLDEDWYSFTMNGAGTSANFVKITFTAASGNLDLEVYNSQGTRVGSSTGTTGTEQVSLSGLAAGTYRVRVLGAGGATNPSYSLEINPGVATTTPPPTGNFNIQFTFSGLTAAEQAIFQQAAAKWQSVILGDLPAATYNGIAVDDLLIDASAVAIDGVGNVLGQAGPDRFRSGSSLPYHGMMQFDSADMQSMLNNGTLLGVIEHEMGHVLGIGTIWTNKGLLSGASGSNPVFTGAQAVAAYNALFHTNVTGVPVENTGGSGTRNSHWRETTFGNELMTGWVGPGNALPMSTVTIASLADLGYTVNLGAADIYTPPGTSSVQSGGSSGGVTAGGGGGVLAGLIELPDLEPLDYNNGLAARRWQQQVDSLFDTAAFWWL